MSFWNGLKLNDPSGEIIGEEILNKYVFQAEKMKAKFYVNERFLKFIHLSILVSRPPAAVFAHRVPLACPNKQERFGRPKQGKNLHCNHSSAVRDNSDTIDNAMHCPFLHARVYMLYGYGETFIQTWQSAQSSSWAKWQAERRGQRMTCWSLIL